MPKTTQPCKKCKFGPNGSAECQYLEFSLLPVLNDDGVCVHFKEKQPPVPIPEIDPSLFFKKGFSTP